MELSILMLLEMFMVGKEVCWLLDEIVVLKDEGKMNLFADFPIGATIQDGGKRKRTNDVLFELLIYSLYLNI